MLLVFNQTFLLWTFNQTFWDYISLDKALHLKKISAAALIQEGGGYFVLFSTNMNRPYLMGGGGLLRRVFLLSDIWYRPYLMGGGGVIKEGVFIKRYMVQQFSKNLKSFSTFFSFCSSRLHFGFRINNSSHLSKFVSTAVFFNRYFLWSKNWRRERSPPISKLELKI